MPNWNSNAITIKGPVDKIRALWDAANPNSEYAGLLEAMVPIGEWDYDRAVQAWGTKWDINGEGLEFTDLGDGTATIEGWADSAWSPPIEAFATYCGNNDDVTAQLDYFEPGMAFIGRWTNTDGEQTYEDVGALLETTADEDPMLYELMEYFDVWGWYETDEEDEENLEIDLDGGLSAINE
jgi:hypothetical protein